MTYNFFVGEKSGISLRGFLIKRHGFSTRLLTRIKYDGSIIVNGKDVRLSEIVQIGDRITVHLPSEEIDMIPVETPIDILYEDYEVLVINKDANTVTHPTKRHQEDTLGNYVADYLIKKHQSSKIRFVNRLDMDTTGIVIIARNKYVHHYIQSGFAGKPQKYYMAFVHGIPEKDRGMINAPIIRVSPDSIERCISENGKPSITYYEVVERYRDASLLRLELKTGRTHQIRLHLKYLGNPIIGDPLYGDDHLPNYGMARQALHASEIRLSIPQAGKKLFRADFKEDMIELRKRLLNQ